MLGGRKSEDLPLPSEKKVPGRTLSGKMKWKNEKRERENSDDSIQPRGMGS